MISLTFRFVLLNIICLFSYSLIAQKNDVENLLKTRFDLGGDHSKQPQRFVMESRLLQIGPDGTPKDSTIYTLYISCIPSKNPAQGDEYTCNRFTVRSNAGPAIPIPSLINLKYVFKRTSSGKDKNEPMFGIDPLKFDGLVDSTGQKLPIEKMYHVYNAFIDFHSLFVFSEREPNGKGVQNLHQPGDKIVHGAAFSEPGVNIGNQIKEGSVFKNGEITLEFKGLGTMNGKACALLGYDSGASSFTMLMEPMPNMQVNTVGSSHYWGDIFKDLQGGWIQFGSLHELVVSETVVGTNKIHSVIERSIEIRNLQK